MVRSVRRDSRIASPTACRSPRTSVRSLASIATSVPVPIAIPRSACASAPASFTPSPTIATTRPSACSRSTTRTLSAGSTSAITSSMPTCGRDRARRGLVVAGEQHRRQPERAQLGDRRGARGLHRVGHHERAAQHAVPRRRAPRCAPCASAAALARAGRVVEVHRPVGEQQLAPGDHRVALDHALHAEALAVGEALDRRKRAEPRAARARRWPGRSGAPTRARARRRCAAARRRSVPAAGSTSTTRHPPGRDRAGLVEHDGVDGAGRLQHLGPLDEDAELGAAAGAHEDRGRGREPERARAGDDQHRDRGGERRGDALPGADPEAEGARRRAGSRPARTPPRSGRRAAAPAPCRSARRRRAGRSARARCRRRPAWPAPRVGRRRSPSRRSPGRPGPTSTGTDSPVSSDASTADVPVLDHAVGGDLLAGPHHEAVADAAARRSGPGPRRRRRSTATSLAPSSISARSAAPERRLARASK